MSNAHDPRLDLLEAPSLLKLGDILKFAVALPFEGCDTDCDPTCQHLAKRLEFASEALQLLCKELIRKREEALDAYGDYTAAVGAIDSQRQHLQRELDELRARLAVAEAVPVIKG
jgi:hypothetical protein